MKILFCGYREWSLKIFKDLQKKYELSHSFDLATSPEELENKTTNIEWDAIFVIGWSWKISERIVDNMLVVGMHPSDLPLYAGGSPIQNQVIDGVSLTKATLFKLNSKIDAGEIIDKEDLDLRGHLNEIFSSIEKSTTILLERFLENFPNYRLDSQDFSQGFKKKRISPEKSNLPLPNGYTCESLWNFIRCREDPYPSAFFEDETGKIEIKWVEFSKK